VNTRTRTLAPAPGGFTMVDCALLLLVVIWGLNFAAIKFALAQFDPLAYSALRFVTASLVLLAIAAARPKGIHIARRDWPAVVALGLVGHTAYQIMFAYGLRDSSTGNAALILALVPVFVAVIGTATGLEGLRAVGWLGVGASFGGITLLVLGAPGAGGATVTGDLRTLGGALAWSLYTVFGRPLLVRYSPLVLTAVTMAVGAAGLAVAGLPALLSMEPSQLSMAAWAAWAYATFAGLVVAYVIWYTGVQRLGGARTAVYSNLVPVVALVVGWVFLGETLAPLQAAGAGLAIGGVALARRGQKEPGS